MLETIKDHEVFHLADKIDYKANDSNFVVVNKNDKAEIVLGAFDANLESPAHDAPADAILFALEGEGVLEYEGKAYTLKAGDNFYLKQGASHVVKSITPFKFCLSRIF